MKEHIQWVPKLWQKIKWFLECNKKYNIIVNIKAEDDISFFFTEI